MSARTPTTTPVIENEIRGPQAKRVEPGGCLCWRRARTVEDTHGQCPFCKGWFPLDDFQHPCRPWGPPPSYAMPLRPPTVPGMHVICIRPFYVQCACTPCRAWILVDGGGQFGCPGCGCHVIVT